MLWRSRKSHCVNAQTLRQKLLTVSVESACVWIQLSTATRSLVAVSSDPGTAVLAKSYGVLDSLFLIGVAIRRYSSRLHHAFGLANMGRGGLRTPSSRARLLKLTCAGE
jgi:hypothetical protein